MTISWLYSNQKTNINWPLGLLRKQKKQFFLTMLKKIEHWLVFKKNISLNNKCKAEKKLYNKKKS